jgi:fumarate reductase flavoprotein subunit
MKFTYALPLACVFALWSSQASAAEHALLGKHAKNTVTCYHCHQEENPKNGAGVTDASCIACHGDLAELAEQTKGLPVNPHTQPKAPHPGPVACKECHRQHQAPVVTCLTCHPKFKFNAK